MGIIYCYTNKITGKKYVGQTIHPEQRKRSHLHEAVKRQSDYYFHRSIRKYGWENFDYEIIEHTEHLTDRETHWIRELDTLWPNGYNQIEVHSEMSEDIRQKISKTKKEKIASMTLEERKRLTEKMCENNKGSKRSEETKKLLSEKTKEYLKNNPRPKRVWTQEMKDRQSALLKEKYNNGIGRWSKVKKEGP